jgi:hypothetical protein
LSKSSADDLIGWLLLEHVLSPSLSGTCRVVDVIFWSDVAVNEADAEELADQIGQVAILAL